MPAVARCPGLHERNHFELSSQETGKQGNDNKQDSLAIGQQRRQRQHGCRESQVHSQLVDSETSTIAQGFCRLLKKRQRRKTFAKQRTRQSVNGVAREPGSGRDTVLELRRPLFPGVYGDGVVVSRCDKG